MKPAALSFEALRDAVERLPDDRLASSRRAALAHLAEHGLPTTRNEDWKYTDLAPVIDISNRWLQRERETAPSHEREKMVEQVCRSIDADWLVICDGAIDNRFATDFEQPGISVTRLSEHGGELQFGMPLSDLNAALLQDGLRIHIAGGATPSRPVGILLIDHAATSPGMSQARIEIELEANSAASFVEYHVSSGAADHYANTVTTLRLGDNSRADCVRIQNRAGNHSQTGRLSVVSGRDSRFRHCAFDLGGKFIRNDLHVDIARPGAQVEFNGLYLAGDQQHIDNHTRADHRVGPATSTQEYRGIVAGSARGVWNGKAIVYEGADGTDASQTNHNLLLSDKAEVDAKPELEIYADDVKCSHGTTVGELDETALFYLRTRGLSKHEAKQVLTRAFAQAIVSKSPIASMHDTLADRIADRLANLLQGAGA